MTFFEGCPVGWGSTRARGGWSRGFGSGGVGGRGTGPRNGANVVFCARASVLGGGGGRGTGPRDGANFNLCRI